MIKNKEKKKLIDAIIKKYIIRTFTPEGVKIFTNGIKKLKLNDLIQLDILFQNEYY